MPRKPRRIRLHSPMGGLQKKTSFRNTFPFTSPDLQNVRPADQFDNRRRLGSRPGLLKPFQEDLGGPIRLLSNMVFVEDKEAQEAHETLFTNLASSIFDTVLANWSFDNTNGRGTVFNFDEGGAYWDVDTDFDTSFPYTISMFINEDDHTGAGNSVYEILCRTDSSASKPGAANDGVVVQLTLDVNGNSSGSFIIWEGGGAVSTGMTAIVPGAKRSGWFTVVINGDRAQVSWAGEQIFDNGITVQGGTELGPYIDSTGLTSEAGRINDFNVDYYVAATQNTRLQFGMASASSKLFREVTPGVWEQVSTSATLNSVLQLTAVELGQKLYIADYGDLVGSATSATLSNSGLTITSSITDWDSRGVNSPDFNFVCIVSDGTGTVVNGTYRITTAGATLILTTTTGGADGDECSIRVERGVKVYNPADNTLALTVADSDKGFWPAGNPIITSYRDRIVLAGEPAHVWYMSRQSNPNDWEYDASFSDFGRAVAGTNADAGNVGGPIRAVIPHSDDLCIFGGNDLYVLRGDPVYGGNLDLLSRDIGVIDRNAWARDTTGGTWILSADGLYYIPAGASSLPVSVSRDALPQELLDIDTANFITSMDYDKRDRGIQIYVTPATSVAGTNFWVDLNKDPQSGQVSATFWPVVFGNTAHQPFYTLPYRANDPEDDAVLLGCRDGFVRKFDNSAGNDDVVDKTEIVSYAVFGPIPLGGSDHNFGQLLEMVATLASGSDDVDWEIRVGSTYEEAASASAHAVSGTWVANLNNAVKPRARGICFYLRIENSIAAATATGWALENIIGVVKEAGKSIIR